MTLVVLARPWLGLDLGRMRRVLSFAPHRPGFVTARHILWREVRDTDLPPGLDVESWLSAELARQGRSRAVAMLTSRDIATYVRAEAEVEGMRALCIATVGLGNAETAGARRFATIRPGTINLAVVLEAGLTEAAQIEALTIAAEARTAAVMDSGLTLPGGVAATGTGTDCIALVADPGSARFAGLHTAVGEALGRAVRSAVAEGARAWIAENGSIADGYPPA